MQGVLKKPSIQKIASGKGRIFILKKDISFSICMLDDHLLQAKIVLPHDVPISEICDYCSWSHPEL